MQRLSARVCRTLQESSIANLFNGTVSRSYASNSRRSFYTFSVQRKFNKPQQESVPCNFVKWSSLGFFRTSKFASGFTPLQAKPLNSIMDVERAKNKSPEDLVLAWDDFHLGRGHIGLTMKANLYRLLEQRSADCQHFVIPLWKGGGYTTMFVQDAAGQCYSAQSFMISILKSCFDNQLHLLKNKRNSVKVYQTQTKKNASFLAVKAPYMVFTGLEDYKARGSQASPYFTVSHYTEFAESKDLVLIRGDVVFTSKINDSEAKWLIEITQYKLVERFNKQTRDFEFKDVLQALEMPIL
ncbi:hypothetical protein V2J09_017004 [Rumex salicifolius]